jgi:flagella basal body P-ring formation protein FlgA
MNNRFLSLAAFFTIAVTAAVTQAATLVPSAAPLMAETLSRQDPELLRQTIEEFLTRQTATIQGEVKVEVGRIDSRVNLIACDQPEAFLTRGNRVWGKTSVGVRCLAPSAWTIYVSATVHVIGDYIASAVPLVHGQVVTANDIAPMRGDLTMLPPGVITDAALAIGRTASSSIQAGAPLRQDILRSQQAVQIGQTVHLLSSGNGFRVSSEARALANGAEGQTVQARTPGGQVISGIAKLGGIVVVGY